MSVLRYVDTEALEVRNPLFLVNTEVDDTFPTDDRDIGIIGKYYDGTNIVYAGLFRDASDAGKFKLFDSLQELPLVDTGSVNVAGTGYAKGSLDVQNIHAFGNGTVDGTLLVTGTITGSADLIINGTVTTLAVATLTVEDNIIIANSGPANQKPDGGFVVRRTIADVILDTPKQLGTASAGGTTTTIELQAANGHGTTLDYYVGWIIDFGGDVTGSSIVTTSTAADPPVLTFSPAASGATTISTTYNLYNKQYVGTIYDASTDKITFYGFPRENLMDTIDPADATGNLADYIDTRARDVYVDRDLYVQGVIKASLRADDNIMAVNAGPTNSEDSGYVVQRTPARVATDTALQSGTASAAGTTTTLTVQAANAHGTTLDYYKGWIIKFGGDRTGTSTITTNTAANPTVLTFTPAASGATTTSTTYELFNKVYVGTIYDESTDTYMAVGFPREVGESVIDPVSPVNGNIPSYVNMAVNDLTINGTLNLASGYLQKTKTQIATTTFSAADMKNYNIIYLNPTGGNTIYYVPEVSTLALPTDRSVTVEFVNIHATNRANITRTNADTIEGLTTLALSKLYAKTVLTASDQLATAYTIKG